MVASGSSDTRAVDHGYQGQGLGCALLKDALLRIVNASELVGARPVLVHAIDQEAIQFMIAMAFVPSHYWRVELVQPAAARAG